MSRDKQIEEMANTINEMDKQNAHYYDETLQEHEAFADCFTIAKYLYDKGYRKASDVAREIFEEIEKIVDTYGDEYGTMLVLDEDAFADLKKKYESEVADDEN